MTSSSTDQASPPTLPPAIDEIATEVAEAYEVSPTPVAVALLAMLSSLSGPVIRCIQPGRTTPSGFNLMVVTPPQATPYQGWLNFLQDPLRRNQMKWEGKRASLGTSAVQARLKELAEDEFKLRAANKPEPEIRAVVMQKGNHAFMLKSRYLERTLQPSRLAWAVRECADGAVLVGESQFGVEAEIRSEKEVDIAQLSRWMAASWEGDILLLDKKDGVAGQLQFVRSVPEPHLHRKPIHGWLMGHHPFPVLFCRQSEIGRTLPRNSLQETSNRLARLFSRALSLRLHQNPIFLGVPESGYEILERTRASLSIANTGTPRQDSPREIEWLPEIIFRMAVTLSLYCNEELEGDKIAIPEKEIETIASWTLDKLAPPHREIVHSLYMPPSASRTLTGLELTDEEQRIFHRITERPGITRRELQRSLSGLTADERDRALSELFFRNLVVTDSRGRLSVG